MKKYLEITDILAREIIDSNGNPTVEVEVYTDISCGTALIPSGSAGIYAAAELRDGDKSRYSGLGVKSAVNLINNQLADELIGVNIFSQRYIDKTLLSMDGTPNKENLGANTILGISLASAVSAANALGLPLYRYIGGTNARTLPVPMMTVLNGGILADSSADIKEFMIMPITASCFSAGLRMCCEVYHSLKKLLSENGCSVSVGDNGGFVPNLKSDAEAFELIEEAVKASGYNMESDFKMGLNADTSQWYRADGTYKSPKSEIAYTKSNLVNYWEQLCGKYNIVSIEDGAGAGDTECWQLLTEKLGEKVRLVGGDIFASSAERLKNDAASKAGNAVIINPRHTGTLSETLDAAETAHRLGYGVIMSYMSGETEDSIISDIAVAVNCGHIKFGAPCRGERTAKYNRLLRIEQELEKQGRYGSGHL